MTDHTEQAQLISDCEARESRLSDWESNFIDSVGRQLAAGKGLTLNQATTLEEVWERATAKG